MSSLLFPVYSPGIRWQRWPQYCYRIKIKSSRRPGPRVLSLNRMINMWEAGGTFLLRSHGDLETCVYTIMSPDQVTSADWMSLEILNHRQEADHELHELFIMENLKPDLSWLWVAWPDPSNGVKLGQKPPARAPAPGLIPPGSPRPMTRARSRRLRCQFSLIKHHKMRQKNERLSLQPTGALHSSLQPLHEGLTFLNDHFLFCNCWSWDPDQLFPQLRLLSYHLLTFGDKNEWFRCRSDAVIISWPL